MRLSALLLITLFTHTAFAVFTTTCNTFPEPLPGGFCIHTPTQNASSDILYHLHGNGGSQQTWQDSFYYPEQIRAEWLQKNHALPTVVSISFGPTWLLVEKNEKSVSGLFEVLTKKLIPTIESQLGGLKGRRLLLGESMGGFNSIQISLKTDLFTKAAILCAPISPISPFSPMSDIETYVKTTTAWQYYKNKPQVVLDSVEAAVGILQVFMSENEWSKADPITLAKSSSSPTEFYVATGFYDEFASYEGNILFAQALKENKKVVDWRPQWGGHCAIDIPSLAEFLVK